MEMLNYTPFVNLRFYHTDKHGHEFGVLVAKGTYRVGSGGLLAVADEQAPIVLTDMYHGELNTSSLWIPSDLVPSKPRTDIIVNAVARPDGGGASRAWTCGLRVEGEHPIEKRLRVTGPRYWTPLWSLPPRMLAGLDEASRARAFKGWELTEPEPAASVAVHYELAYGGLLERPRGPGEEPWYDACEHNPIGRGWLDWDASPRDRPVPAPQITDADGPDLAPMREVEPAGLGAIPPAWLPRRPLGGTFDETWLESVWPRWPADHDTAYHNSAHPGLIYPGYLRGTETVAFFGLGPIGRRGEISLPRTTTVACLHGEDGAVETRRMDLDTAVFDVAADEPDEHRVFLTWRTSFPAGTTRAIALIAEDVASPDGSHDAPLGGTRVATSEG